MERPVIKIKPTILDKVLEAAAILMLVLLWAIAIYGYSHLPEIVPIHFNGAGEPDGYSGKKTVFIMPVIGTFLYFILTVINAYPHIFNYPVTITAENAEKQYGIAVRMIRTLKLSVLFIFCAIDFSSYKVAMGLQEGLGNYFIIFVLAVVFVPIVFYLLKSMKK